MRQVNLYEAKTNLSRLVQVTNPVFAQRLAVKDLGADLIVDADRQQRVLRREIIGAGVNASFEQCAGRSLGQVDDR